MKLNLFETYLLLYSSCHEGSSLGVCTLVCEVSISFFVTERDVHQNGIFIYFGGSNCLVDIFKILSCSLDPVVFNRYGISYCVGFSYCWLNLEE